VGRSEFERFIVEDLAPSLKAGDVVVWDNHTIHQSDRAREAVKSRGAVLLSQPRYSPEYNAAELLWSKLKRLAREAGADTVEALHEAMTQACAAVSESDLVGWIEHTRSLKPHA
jgi:transposase